MELMVNVIAHDIIRVRIMYSYYSVFTEPKLINNTHAVCGSSPHV